MSTKHNTKHDNRGRSHYPDRLGRRHRSKAPQMTALEHLQAKHANRVREQGHPWPPETGPSDLEFYIVDGVPYASLDGRKDIEPGSAQELLLELFTEPEEFLDDDAADALSRLEVALAA